MGEQIPIGSRLRVARLAKGLTLGSVSAVAGLTQGYLSKVERDQVSPSVASLVAICTAVGLRVGDLFEPPSGWIEQFDVVVSFGLVEHFENTSQVVSACARYLRPGGQMITLVPTMRGLYGLAYRLLRPAVYRKHIPHSRETLAQAHTDAGLDVTHCDYALGLPGILSAPASHGFPRRLAFAVSRLYWRLERSGFGVPPNRFTSPYVLCIATKPLRSVF